MNDLTSNHCIAFSERDWPGESLLGMYYHSACTNCGKEYIGPKREIFCFICSNSKKTLTMKQVIYNIYHIKRSVAQLVEQVLHTDKVSGSIPL